MDSRVNACFTALSVCSHSHPLTVRTGHFACDTTLWTVPMFSCVAGPFCRPRSLHDQISGPPFCNVQDLLCRYSLLDDVGKDAPQSDLLVTTTFRSPSPAHTVP